MAAPASQPSANLETNATKQDQPHYTLPSKETLQKAGDFNIKDENGKEIALKSLYEGQPGKQLIVFIRHFYCGRCEEYVRFLAEKLPPSTLSTTSPPTTLTIIGCGQPECIPDYYTRTSCPFKIYTDPTRQLYTAFDMLVKLGRPEDGPPEYVKTGLLANSLSSMKNIVFSGPKGLRGGNYAQNGGEWLFEGGELRWGRRMRNTEDHTPIAELREVLGLASE